MTLRAAAVSVLACPALILAGCSDSEPVKAVKAQLRDPYSARIASASRCGSTNTYAVRVNAKNAYGAYVGEHVYLYREGAVLAPGGEDLPAMRAYRDLLAECLRAVDPTAVTAAE